MQQHRKILPRPCELPNAVADSWMGMGFIRVRDGQIVEAWNTFDFQGMNEQIGR